MPNGLYQLARRLCVVLNHPKLNDVLLSHAVRADGLCYKRLRKAPFISPFHCIFIKLLPFITIPLASQYALSLTLCIPCCLSST